MNESNAHIHKTLLLWYLMNFHWIIEQSQIHTKNHHLITLSDDQYKIQYCNKSFNMNINIIMSALCIQDLNDTININACQSHCHIVNDNVTNKWNKVKQQKYDNALRSDNRGVKRYCGLYETWTFEFIVNRALCLFTCVTGRGN